MATREKIGCFRYTREADGTASTTVMVDGAFAVKLNAERPEMLQQAAAAIALGSDRMKELKDH